MPTAETAFIAAASGGSSRSYVASSAARRLTPTECARLQGFPDDYLDITYRGKLAADGPKYKALGNSMAVPVMVWIGQRIAAVDALTQPLNQPRHHLADRCGSAAAGTVQNLLHGV